MNGLVDAVGNVWRQQAQWSKAADRFKAHVIRWRFVVLLLGTLGAVLQTLAATLSMLGVGGGVNRWIALAGAVALGLTGWFTLNLLKQEYTRRWLRARSVSEGLKSEAYRARARASPYDDEHAAVRLTERGAEIREFAVDLDGELAALGEVPVKPLPEEGIAYAKNRVEKQIEGYYRPRANRNAKRARLFGRLEATALFASALIGFVATGGEFEWLRGVAWSGSWVAVLTTVGAAFAAHAATNRYGFQASSFYSTAQELQDLIVTWQAEGAPGPDDDGVRWSKFVGDCEQVISTENRAWMAKLDRQAEKAPRKGN